LLASAKTQVTLLDPAGLVHREPSFRSGAQRLSQQAPDRISVVSARPLDAELLIGYDLLLTSYAGWSRAAESRAAWLGAVPSTLIMRP
ncbi:MAG TPA: hypothetical protein PK760_12500, partial [Flavobacteriales bacterium]|nr:hypothetical protein [Flavobacteriales bacterium]